MHVYCSISGHNEEAWVECLDEVKPRVSGRRITKGIRSDINRNPTLIPLYNAHYLILSWPRLSATIRQIRYDSIVDGIRNCMFIESIWIWKQVESVRVPWKITRSCNWQVVYHRNSVVIDEG